MLYPAKGLPSEWFFSQQIKKNRLTKSLIMINVVQYTKRGAHLLIGFVRRQSSTAWREKLYLGISTNENEACGL